MNDVSVIIPSFKPQDYIWDCLDSLYSQTLEKTKYEVIVILNGCDEPWSSNIRRWIESHGDMITKLIVTETAGVSNARNIGIKRAQGQYITFIDDDDYVSPQYLDGLLSTALNHKDAVVISNSISFDDTTNIINEDYSLRKVYKVLSRNSSRISLFHARAIFNGPWMKLFPKSFIQGNYFDTRFKNSEDALYMYLISRNFKDLVLVPEDCVYYRRFRPDSAVLKNKKKCEVILNQMRFSKEILKIYVSNPTKYDIPFTISRILASIKTIYIQFKK